MLLERIELRQVCQHEHLLWTLGPGLVVCQGPNGAGKSNALNVAVYAALTNTYARHPCGKRGLVRQQCASDESSLIAVTFLQDGTRFHVERGLQNPERHLLQRDGLPDLTSPTAIKTVMEETLGLSRRLIDDYVFVSQHSLFAFLLADSAERAKAFAHLCGTSEIEGIWKLLGETAQADGLLLRLPDDNRKALQATCDQLQKEAKQLAADILRNEAHLLAGERLQQVQALCELRLERARLRAQVELLQQSAAARLAEARQAKAAIPAFAAEQEITQEGLGEKRKELKVRRARMQRCAAAESDRRARKIWQAELDKLRVRPLPDPPAAFSAAEQMAADKVQIQTELQNLLKLQETVDAGQPACYACGTPVADLQPPLPERLRRRQELQERLEEIRTAEQQVESYRKLLTKTVEQNSADNRRAAELRESLSTLSPPAEVLPDGFAEETERLAAELDLQVEQLAAVTRAQEKFFEARKNHQRQVQELDAARSKLAALPASDDCDKAAEQWEQHTTAAAVLPAARTQLLAVNSRLDENRAELLRQEKLFCEAEKIRSWVQDVSAVRELFHRDHFPRKIHAAYLARAEASINELLEQFHSPFSIRAVEDLSFVASFRNGTSVPAVALSGGQRVMLALAFRLTMSSMFAARAGMMILDEPTDGLDGDNHKLAVELFRRVGEVARSSGNQLIVITHDESLAAVGDQCLQLRGAV